MHPQEMHRIIQYVTARTSYSREIIEHILRTGLDELNHLANTSASHFSHDALKEYICQWTISRTRQPEILVREIFDCAGKWLDEMCKRLDYASPIGGA